MDLCNVHVSSSHQKIDFAIQRKTQKSGKHSCGHIGNRISIEHNTYYIRVCTKISNTKHFESSMTMSAKTTTCGRITLWELKCHTFTFIMKRSSNKAAITIHSLHQLSTNSGCRCKYVIICQIFWAKHNTKKFCVLGGFLSIVQGSSKTQKQHRIW